MSYDNPDKRRRCVDKIAGWLRVLIAEDQVTELRALNVQRGRERPHVESGFFDGQHLREMAEAAFDLTDAAKGVYFTMNPLKPDILARRANRVDYANDGELAGDKDVIGRRWLLIDADPVRDPFISATDPEKQAALETLRTIRADLAAQGWSPPILGDSGNGGHLLYRIDLPADDGGLVQRILQALAAKYDSPTVHIDQKVFNAARICKLPGTMARKGDNIKGQRPHRWAKLLEVPT
jgi:hypothetical protein